MKPIRAGYLLDRSSKVAYIESARVIGIEVIERKPDCYNSSTYGLGVLIKDALAIGVKKIFIFLGGSATCDGGVGMAAALGYEFYSENRVIERPIAKDIKYFQNISNDAVDEKLVECEFVIGYDVDIPLHGDLGTALNYSKQKGATAEQVELLELAMINLSALVTENYGFNMQDLNGAGAAGGLGAGSAFFLKARLESGFDVLSNISGMEEHVKNSDLVITGEGHIDNQSFDGRKMISKVYDLARKYNKPVWLISAVRSMSLKEIQKRGFDKIESIYRSAPKEINNAETQRQLFKIAKKWAFELTEEE